MYKYKYVLLYYTHRKKKAIKHLVMKYKNIFMNQDFGNMENVILFIQKTI